MRFIIHEQPYEKPLAAGRLHYQVDGRATGAVESWRLTTAVSGYRFLRVDLDAREAESGRSTLYHVVLGEDAHVQRLKYRFWDEGEHVAGNLLLQEELVIASRKIGETAVEEEMTLPAEYWFWFPTSVGLSLLAGAADKGTVTAVTLNTVVDEPVSVETDFFTLQRFDVSLTLGGEEELTVARHELAVRPLSVRWADQERTVWLDEHNWPVKMVRDDGLTAVETRYLRYQS